MREQINRESDTEASSLSLFLAHLGNRSLRATLIRVIRFGAMLAHVPFHIYSTSSQILSLSLSVNLFRLSEDGLNIRGTEASAAAC